MFPGSDNTNKPVLVKNNLILEHCFPGLTGSFYNIKAHDYIKMSSSFRRYGTDYNALVRTFPNVSFIVNLSTMFYGIINNTF